MSPIQYDIEIDRDLELQIMKLRRFGAIYNQRMRQAAGQGVVLLVADWRRVAPVDQGRYRNSIAGEVRQMAGDVVGIASTNVRTGPRSFPYPAALEESERYHYRRGPRRGQPTRHHAKNVLKQAQAKINQLYRRAVDLIVRDLAVGD
jgi:hypothetical protein